MKQFKFILFLFALIFSLQSWSVDSALLQKIQDNLCADDSLNKVQTEAAAPCIDCVAKETNSSSPATELKSVAKKVLSELEQNELDKLELEFFKYVEGRGLLSSDYFTTDSLPNMEMQLKNYEETVKSMQKVLDNYKAKNNPETKKDLEESKQTGVIGTKTKETLKAHFKEAQSSQENHIKYYVEQYDKIIAQQKQHAEKYPDQKAMYEKNIVDYEKAKASLIESSEKNKSFLDWLEKSGKKEELSADKWSQVVSIIDFQVQVASQYSSVIPHYQSSIQTYQNEMVSLKTKIEEKKNVKYGEIHSPGFKKTEGDELAKYRKTAEQINIHHKSNPGYKACGMSEAEILALRWYTSSHYGWINKALRSGGEEAQKIEPYKKGFEQCFGKASGL